MPYHQGLLPQRRQPDDLGGLLDPNIVKRGMLLPLGRTKQGEMEFAVPEILLSLARSARLPGRVAQGYPFEPEDVTEMAMNVAGTGYLGGGLLTGSVPRGTVLGANVWHGGPNRWMPEPGFPQGRPLLSRVGTGEGAQAYGHGFYSAEAPGVALDYKTRLTDRGGNTVVRGDVGEVNMPTWLANRVENKGIDSAIREWETRIAKMREELPTAHQPWNIESNIDRMSKQLNEMRGIKGKLDIERGHLKKLDIPDEDVAKMLDWDAPLSDMPASVQTAVKENIFPVIFGKAGWAKIKDHPRTGTAITGEDIYRRLEEFYSGTVGRRPETQAAASEALRKAGIPGLKYYDQMSRARTGGKLVDVSQKDGKWFATIKVEGREQAWQGVKSDAFTKSMPLESEAAARAWAEKEMATGTRNYVVWDQDVLNRTKILAQ